MSIADGTGDQFSDEPTPPMGFPAPVAPRRSRRRMWLSLVAAGVAVVLLGAGYTLVRHLIDGSSYDDGHTAYARADCAAAIGSYDEVINGWRIVTMGDTVRRAESEKAECLVFRDAADRQRAGEAPAAIVSYANFVSGRAASPLTDAARQRVAELFAQPNLDSLATVVSCDALPALRDQKLLTAPAAPRFYAACGAAYAKEVQLTQSVDAYAQLFTDYGDDPVAAETEAKLSADTSWCISLDRFRDHPVLSTRGDLFPGLLATCAKAPTTPDSVAIKDAEEFLRKFPGHRLGPEVTATLAQRLNKASRDSAGAEDLGPADLEGTVGGPKAVVLVYNDADEPLRIALSGPEPRVEVIDPCASCPPMPVADENSFCRDQATEKRLLLAPGEYDIALDRPQNTEPMRPSYAHWSLQPGKQYFYCVTIVGAQ